MLGLLLDIQLASCVFPCGLGNRRVGSEVARLVPAVGEAAVADGEGIEVRAG